MHNVTIAVMMFISTMGPSLVIAVVGFASIKAIGRNPSAGPKIQTAMMFAFLCAEGIAAIALLIIYLLFRKG